MSDPTVLSFDEFWQWLKRHGNCVLGAGTPDTALYDHDDFHWSFDREVNPEGQEELLVQVLRGKQLIGELVIPRVRMAHVQAEPREEGEVLFECFEESEEGPIPAFFFTLSHGLEEDADPTSDKASWVH